MELPSAVVWNGKTVDNDSFRRLITNLSTPGTLKRYGGFLVKTAIEDDVFHFGSLPVIEGDVRNRHYDIVMRTTAPIVLTGFFNADGSVGLLYVPPGGKRPSADLFPSLALQIEMTVRILAEFGYPADRPFDWITRKFLKELLFSEPEPAFLRDLIGKK